MTAFDALRTADDPGIGTRPAWGTPDMERLARMAEAGNWITPAPRRRLSREMVARLEGFFAGLVLAGVVAGIVL